MRTHQPAATRGLPLRKGKGHGQSVPRCAREVLGSIREEAGLLPAMIPWQPVSHRRTRFVKRIPGYVKRNKADRPAESMSAAPTRLLVGDTVSVRTCLVHGEYAARLQAWEDEDEEEDWQDVRTHCELIKQPCQGKWTVRFGEGFQTAAYAFRRQDIKFVPRSFWALEL